MLAGENERQGERLLGRSLHLAVGEGEACRSREHVAVAMAVIAYVYRRRL